MTPERRTQIALGVGPVGGPVSELLAEVERLEAERDEAFATGYLDEGKNWKRTLDKARAERDTASAAVAELCKAVEYLGESLRIAIVLMANDARKIGNDELALNFLKQRDVHVAFVDAVLAKHRSGT